MSPSIAVAENIVQPNYRGDGSPLSPSPYCTSTPQGSTRRSGDAAQRYATNPACIMWARCLNGFSFATATAAHEPNLPTSLSSPLVRAFRASLTLYSLERISDTTNTNRL